MLSAILLLAAADDYAKLAAVPVERFSERIERRSDDLTTDVLLTTRKGHEKLRQSGGWLLGTESDLWLSASIDKRTHKTEYVVIARVTWIGSSALFDRATYAMPDGAKEAPVVGGGNVSVSSCVTAGCSYNVTLGVPVDLSDLAKAAGTGQPLRFRYQSTSGRTFENAIPANEIKALLIAVEQEF